MKKKYLIKKNKEYRYIYSRGISLANPYMALYQYKNNLNYKRFGFSISKKIGKAVRRNFIRRRFKALCQINEHLFADGYDYVLIARKGIINVSFAELAQSLVKLTCRISSRKGKEKKNTFKKRNNRKKELP